MTAPRLFDRLGPEVGLPMQVWAERLLERLESLIQTFAIASSWTVPSNVLSAADVGSDVTITIADHTRYYGDGTSVAITGDRKSVV